MAKRAYSDAILCMGVSWRRRLVGRARFRSVTSKTWLLCFLAVLFLWVWRHCFTPCVQLCRLHRARGARAPAHLQMAGYRGHREYRRTANKKPTKLYWPSRKRSPKRQKKFRRFAPLSNSFQCHCLCLEKSVKRYSLTVLDSEWSDLDSWPVRRAL